MDIGKEERTIIVTPIENPIPAKREQPARRPQRAPAKPATPSQPTRRPQRAPVKK